MAPDADWWPWRWVIYQIYPRSFQDTSGRRRRDLNRIAQPDRYIASLGCRCPLDFRRSFQPRPMKDFGYDVLDYTQC